MADPNNSDELNAKIDELIRSLSALTDSVRKSSEASVSAAEAAGKAATAAGKAATNAGKSASTINKTSSANNTQDNTKKVATSLAGEIANQIQKAAAVYGTKQARTAASTAKKSSAAKGQPPSVQSAAGVKAFAAAQARNSAILGQASKSAAELGASFGKLGSLIRQGSGGVGDFAENIASSSKPVLDFAAAVGGPATKGVVFFGKILLDLGVAAAKQAQKELATYQKLSAAGVGAVGSLDGLRSLAFQLNYSTENLEQFSTFLASNSKNLAMFAGGATEGAKVLGRLSSDIEQSGIRDKFYALGQGYEAQNATLMNFALNETRMGRSRQLQEKNAAKTFDEYYANLVKVSRQTGATVEEQQEAQNQAMAVEQFRIKLEQAKAAGDQQEIERLTRYQKTAEQLSNVGAKDAASAILAQAGGFMGGKGTQGINILTGGEAFQTMESGKGIDPQVLAQKVLTQIGKGFTERLGTLGQVGGAEDLTGMRVGPIFDALEKLKNGLIVEEKIRTDIAGKQDKEFEREADRAGKALKQSQNVSDFFGKIIPAATWTVQKFTNAMKGLTDMLPGAGQQKDEETGKTQQELMRNLLTPGFASGGIATGPNSGHIQLLHGTEAVIPLPDGKTIPVKIDAGSLGSLAGGMNAGPVFNPANETNFLIEKSNEELVKSNVTLDKILTAITGGSGLMGGSTTERVAQEALAEHDHAHPHEPTAPVDPALAKQIGTIVNPLEKMVQTSGFGNRMMDGKVQGHGAIDLAGKIGDKIMAPISGVARVLSEKESGGYGNMVEVTDTVTGVKHMLAHMDKTMVKTGDVIKAGQQIGTVGNTGKSTGAHLHHEMRLKDGTKVDPSQFYNMPGFGTTAGGAATGNPNIARQGRRSGATQYPSIGMMSDSLGKMSEKYETGGRGSGTVGWDKVGGTSYGKYQIASKVGAMKDFLKFAEQSGRGDVAKKLREAGAETDTGGTSGKSVDVWKQMAAAGELGDLEHQFIKKRSFDPAMAGLKDPKLKKMIEGNKGLQEMMWSTSVQHGGGGASGIMNKVFKEGMSQEDLVKAVYAERGTRFGGSTEEVQKSVKNRFISEQGDVMAMLGMPAGKGSTMTAAAPGMPAAGAIPGMTAGAATPGGGGLIGMLGGMLGGGAPAGGGGLMGMLGGMLGGSATTPLAGVTAGGAPGAIGGDISAITQAMQAQTEATQTAITSGMENLTSQLVSKIGTGGTNDPAVPALLSEMITAQREQTGAINRLIQVNTS
jgi:murein DD-endopeptidase MepM/ murein hydrolase activator NlpD